MRKILHLRSFSRPWRTWADSAIREDFRPGCLPSLALGLWITIERGALYCRWIKSIWLRLNQTLWQPPFAGRKLSGCEKGSLP